MDDSDDHPTAEAYPDAPPDGGAGSDDSDGDGGSSSDASGPPAASDEDGSTPAGSGLEEEQNAERVRRLCGALFQWTCVNCTRPNALAPQTDEMLAFAAAVDRRLVAQRGLTKARLAYSQRLREYNDAVEAREVAAREALAAASSAATTVARGDADHDVDVDVTTTSAGGVTAHAHVHVHSSAAAGSAQATASVEVSSGTPATAPPPVSRRDVLASVANAIGLTHDAAAVDNNVDAEPPVPPVRPDFDALEAALPPVPPVPPTDADFLSAQMCEDCGAPFCEPSPSTNDAGWSPSAAAGAGTGAGGTGAGNYNAAASAAVAAIANTNLSVLSITLQDEDPSDYIERYGLTPDVIGAILSGGCTCRRGEPQGSAAAATEGGGGKGADSCCTQHAPAAASQPPTLLSQRLGAHPLQQSYAGGHGGFAPVTAIVYDDRMLLHEEASRSSKGGTPTDPLRLAVKGVALPPPAASMHPERPDRLRSIAQHLVATGLFQRCKRVPARPVADDEVGGVHAAPYAGMLDGLDALVAGKGGSLHFGSDTYANPHTLTAAKLACGSVVAVTEAVMAGAADRAVALVRPPGHHAEPDAAMGFCMYNNVAVAAWVATRRLGARRVLVVDWDVHHGNGTQHMFDGDPSVLYVSLHRYDRGTFYPGTGGVGEVGTGAGAGYNINVPWDGPGYGDAEYAAAFDEVIMPVAHSYAPDLVLVSAGFDAARGDPLGGCDVTPAGYAHMTSRLLALAGGRVVVALEGGYNLTSISRGMEAVLRVMLGQAPPPLHGLVPARVHGGGGGSSAAAPAGSDGGSDSGASPLAEAYAAAGEPVDPAMAHGVPRGDVFVPTSLDVAEMAARYPGVAGSGSSGRSSVMSALTGSTSAPSASTAAAMRDDALVDAAPAAGAARTIAAVLRTHARYWPVLRAKLRAYQHLFAEADAAQARARGGAGVAAAVDFHPFPSSPSSDDEGGDGDDDDDDDDGGGDDVLVDGYDGAEAAADDVEEEDGADAEDADEDDDQVLRGHSGQGGDEGNDQQDDDEGDGEEEEDDDDMEEDDGDDGAAGGEDEEGTGGSPAKRARVGDT